MMWKWKRPAAFLLAAAMIFTMPGIPAFAVETDVSAVHTGLCEHHPEHTEDCGYTEGTEGAACEHEHTEDCYTLVEKCVHEHDESCYPVLEGSVSENTATPSEAEEARPTACTHECSEESGCITKELSCPHERGEHDDTCGYIPATEGTPCEYTCELCQPKDSGPVLGTSRQESEIGTSVLPQADHTHCVCGGNGDVNGHEHDTAVTWTTADSLPDSAGNYYLTQSVSGSWTVPTGEVNLCLNGQTISGSITVGSGAKLTLTDCTGTGKLQGSGSGSGVSINGGTFNLYEGTITGFVNGVEIGSHNDIQTGSSFTMYGGAITDNKAGSASGGGVFLIGTTNSNVTAPSFTMHGGTISDNTADASDGGGGGVYVGEKCSFTMDGGTITGNTATNGNGGGIYIHMLSRVTISGGEITNNTASGSGIRYGGGIYSESGVTVSNVTITGNNAKAGGGIYGNGTIALTDATVTGNNQYDVYYGGKESSAPELTVSGSVKAGYYANYAWKLPIFVSGTLSEDSVIRVGVYEGIKPNAGGRLLIAEPASGVTLSAENFKADAADSVTSLGEDGKVYLSLCAHEMDDTGYTCKKCHTQFDARIGESAYYQTLAKAFQNAWNGSTITLMRDVSLNGSCSASDTITLDLHGKTITSVDKPINVNEKLTVKDSSEGGGTQALNVKFLVNSNGTLAVDDSYTGDISCVELWAGGALEAYTGTIQELLLGKGNGTGYSVKLWKDNAHCCTVKTIMLAENVDQNLTVGGLLETNHAKCELYGEKDGAWSIVDKSTKIVDLKGYTAYKVQFAECVHQCDNDTVEKPVCSKCGKVLVVKITATASDGKIKTAWFPADSGIENGDGYVEAIQTLNGWSAEGYTDATLMPLCDVHNNSGGIGIASVTLTGKLAVDGGEHLIYSTTVAADADVTFKTGKFYHITVNGKASFVGGTYLGLVTAAAGAEAVFSGGAYQYLEVEDGGTAVVKNSAAFGEDVKVIKGTLTVEGGSFGAAVVVEGDGTMNVNGGSFTGTGLDKVTYGGGAKGTVSGGSFADLYLYSSGTAWLAGGSFTKLSTASSGVLSSLLADGAAYYDQSDNAISGSAVSELNDVTVKTHAHTVDEKTGICSVCQKQMAASLTAGNETSWYLTLDAAIAAANGADGEKTLKLYQAVRASYELTRGPVTLDVNGKNASGVIITVKGIQLTVTGTGTIWGVTASGSSAVVKNSTVKINYITAENGGRLELGGGSYMGLTVKNDGSSASLSGGTYKKIEWGNSYVPANEYLADGYGYKTSDGTWEDGTASVDNVTVTPAPIKSTKVYPNSETDYSGSTFDAKDSTSVTLTVSVTFDESAGLTYTWYRFIDDEWCSLTNSYITQGLTEKYTGADSQTLSITELPAGQTFSYKVQIATGDGYKCFSKPFTVSTCAHDGDKTLQHDETHHWYVCGKCGAELDRAEHSGGTATCTAKAVCSTCQTAYGELGGHTLTKHDAVDATCTVPGNVEYWHCSVCGKNFSDASGAAEIDHVTVDALNHDWGKWTSNGNGTHTRTCQRDSRHTETENCSGGSATCTNAAICTSCGGSYGKELGHDWGEWENTGNAQQHTRTCQRDQSHTETAAHTPGTPANCTTPQTCTACGYEITPANNDHDWNAWESNGNGTHTHTCKNDSSHTETTNCSGGSATCEARAVCDVCHMVYGELAPHTLTHTPAVDATCTTPGNVEYWHCSVCGKNFSDSEGKGELTEITSPALNHNWGAWEKVSETQHQRICQNDGSHKETGDHTPGTAATCKAPANCSICGQSYGEKNPSNHTGGTEVRNQKEATTTTEGYTGDTYCLGCGEKIASGTVIPKLPSSGGGSSSGGGGGSSTPSVSVPVSSDYGGTKLSATISGSTATVSVSGKEIDKVIADGAKSVTVDLSGLSKVDSVKLPASVIAKTEEAEDTGLTIRLPDCAVELDEAALESIASGKTVTVSVQQAKLTDAQQEAVSALAQVAVVVDVDIVVGTVKQSAFDGGRLTISIPYTPEKGEDTSTLAVWYIRDDGSIENKGGSYDAKSGCFVFETDHLSRYLLVHTEQVMGFTDVPANSWYAGAVAWAVEQGITSGTSDTTFSPNVSCTRAQMMTFLWRASGSPKATGVNPFIDVSADAYYYDAVLWAAEKGITSGTTATTFSPDTTLTRSQTVTFLWRANGSPVVSGGSFGDVAADAYYANAVAWAVFEGITSGTGGNNFNPDADCTRAQIVTFMYRDAQ